VVHNDLLGWYTLHQCGYCFLLKYHQSCHKPCSSHSTPWFCWVHTNNIGDRLAVWLCKVPSLYVWLLKVQCVPGCWSKRDWVVCKEYCNNTLHCRYHCHGCLLHRKEDSPDWNMLVPDLSLCMFWHISVQPFLPNNTFPSLWAPHVCPDKSVISFHKLLPNWLLLCHSIKAVDHCRKKSYKWVDLHRNLLHDLVHTKNRDDILSGKPHKWLARI